MPKSVILVVALMLCIFGMNFYTGIFLMTDKDLASSGALSKLLISGLVLVGFIRGNRLAWQWGRYLAFIAGLGIIAAISVPAIANHSLADINWMVLGMGVAAFSIGIALGRPSAVEYFGLICPSCREKTARAANFFYSEAKCKKCGLIW